MGIHKRIKVGNADIGTEGVTTGIGTSSEGGQHGFLPPASSYKNASLGGGPKKSGGTTSPSGGVYPNLPKSRPSGLRKGKK